MASATQTPASRSLAVIGAGWAGLSAAIEATTRGHRVTVFEMAGQPGGRARQVPGNEALGGLDNGQHILIGAYTETLALMARVGVDPAQALLRMPLSLSYPDGSGLKMGPGPAVPAFIAAVLGQGRWTLGERLALLRAAVGWRLRGFRCRPELSVAELTKALPASLRETLIEPLCVAALNTPSDMASAAVFLRVLRDALFAGPGAADLLLPCQRLSALLPAPAISHMRKAGAVVHLGTRIRDIVRNPAGAWLLNGEGFDRVIVATTASESARLLAAVEPKWSAMAAALRFEPIMSLSLRSPGTRLPLPMLALHADQHAKPAQFVFDQGQLGGAAGVLTLVISGAAPWVARGAEVTVAAAIEQLRDQLGEQLRSTPEVLQMLTDKRATFSCTPGLQRPPMHIADGLLAAGDYVEGPYPATLEGAVRSGLAAARSI